MSTSLPSIQLSQENQRLNKELVDLKEELYHVYQENIRLRDVIGRFEQQKEFYGECQAELTRLKKMMREMGQRKAHVPTQREEVKDRIIMKLEDELISTKIELKQVKLELNRVSRMQ